MGAAPERFDVPVAGGELAVYRWPGEGPIVLAAHGITSNHRSWGLVAEALGGDVTLIAPDLRGRGRSGGLPGPYEIAAQADDLAMVLDHIGAEQAVLAGHSMGAFVAATFAVRHAARARELVLVDGGAPLLVPPGATLDDVLAASLGPAMARLDMTFPDRAAYTAFWEEHPAFPDTLPEELEAHVQHDLEGDPPAMRSSCSKEAVRVNGRELFASETMRSAVFKVSCPLTVLWAPRGLFDQPGGLYDAQRLIALPAEEVPDTNHYSILLGEPGARRTAELIRRAACGPAPGTPT